MNSVKVLVVVPWIIFLTLFYLLSCVACAFYVAIKENPAKLK